MLAPHRLDPTHDPALRSWVETAGEHPDFPIQNLPFGVFSPPGQGPRGGVAIGDHILDLAAVHAAGLLDGVARDACAAACGGTLNEFLALGQASRAALRQALSALLASGTLPRPALLHQARFCAMHLPARIGDYTDFYAGIHHATNVGKLFRPEAPLLPNYKHVPIGYHGRASSIRVSGVPVRRPHGQHKRSEAALPEFGPSEQLDYELELGIWIGPGSMLGTPVPIGEASAHIAGYCLLNDWSARDIQAWEYQPLGPFLAKNFATTVSAWIVTPEALAPFRQKQPARPAGDPAPLPYLLDTQDQAEGAIGLRLEVFLRTATMPAPQRVSHGSATVMYWTPAQLVAHHASGGCNFNPGDLLGTGTLSAATPDGYGSLLELSQGGRTPIQIGGEARRFLHDGDEVILRAHAQRDGFVSIGFGECRATVTS